MYAASSTIDQDVAVESETLQAASYRGTVRCSAVLVHSKPGQLGKMAPAYLKSPKLGSHEYKLTNKHTYFPLYQRS